MGGRVEGSGRAYHHDRNPDGPSVVHLRRSEGGSPPPPPTSASHARIAQKEARSRINSKKFDPIRCSLIPALVICSLKKLNLLSRVRVTITRKSAGLVLSHQ